MVAYVRLCDENVCMQEKTPSARDTSFLRQREELNHGTKNFMGTIAGKQGMTSNKL